MRSHGTRPTPPLIGGLHWLHSLCFTQTVNSHSRPDNVCLLWFICCSFACKYTDLSGLSPSFLLPLLGSLILRIHFSLSECLWTDYWVWYSAFFTFLVLKPIGIKISSSEKCFTLAWMQYAISKVTKILVKVQYFPLKWIGSIKSHEIEIVKWSTSKLYWRTLFQ